MYRTPARPRLSLLSVSLVGFAAGIVIATFGTLLFLVLDQDDDAPRCRAYRAKTVDMVNSGPRPCLLYSSGHGSGTVTDTHPQGVGQTPGTGSRTSPKPGGNPTTAKVPPKASAPKAPAAPAPKAPAAPAPKAPSLPKR
ncbi:hypothetical protein [Streptomyces microflavus]|uniref:hypothetical protein n=1 Tax=Streptomyces microflavus TaxID=1919 RepID=UPI003668FFCB